MIAIASLASLSNCVSKTRTAVSILVVVLQQRLGLLLQDLHELNLIRKRCEEGIERAKRKGVTFGRKRKLDKEMVRVAAERYAKGETMAELAEVYGVSEPTISGGR